MTWNEKFKSMDCLGSVLLVGSTSCFLLGISWGGKSFPWASGQVIGTIVGGLAGFALFTVVEHHSKVALFPLPLLRNRTAVVLCIGQFFYGAKSVTSSDPGNGSR
jgi:hypothetical protein